VADGHLVAVDRETQQAIAWRYLQRAPCDVLAEPSPCDGCPLRARCRVERLACSAFVEFVNGRRWEDAEREPTAALYEVAMADRDVAPEPKAEPPPKPEPPPEPARVTAADRAAQWVGQSVGDRIVTGWEYDTRGAVRLLLHCGDCGRDARRPLAHVEHGEVQPCICIAKRQRDAARELARLAEDATIDAREAHARERELASVFKLAHARERELLATVPKPAHAPAPAPKPTIDDAARRARAAARRARRAESDRIDARMRESERADAAGATP
jgi:hypothetical protein